MPYERLDYYNVIAASMRRKFQVPVATGDDLEEKLKKTIVFVIVLTLNYYNNLITFFYNYFNLILYRYKIGTVENVYEEKIYSFQNLYNCYNFDYTVPIAKRGTPPPLSYKAPC